MPALTFSCVFGATAASTQTADAAAGLKGTSNVALKGTFNVNLVEPRPPPGMSLARMHAAMTLQLRTPAFEPGADIPAQFTCDGADVSPALAWTAPPDATQSFALIVDDPDAPRGTWVHWVLYDLPAAERELPEGTPTREQLASGARQGRNDFKKIGYAGPCPPRGPAHRYYFRLYALDTKLDLRAGSTRAQLDRAMRGHVLAQAELFGRYRRP